MKPIGGYCKPFQDEWNGINLKKDTKAASIFDVLDLDISSMSTGNLFVELFRPVTLLWLRLFKRKYFQKIELQITKCQLNIIINSSKYFSLVNRK